MISVISIILDLFNNNIIKKESLFLSLFTMLSVMFIKRDNKYYLKVFLLGVLYDLIFTNYYLLNGIIFLLLGILTKYYYSKVKISIFSNLVLGFLLVILYQGLLFIVLNITKNNINTFNEFLFIIKHFIIINIIYIFIFSLIKKEDK
ncbi:MAG: hypothetical protein J6O56_02345 [Bacilli bacterium]|nr:hypothetical protein [Bacilli bacterium]